MLLFHGLPLKLVARHSDVNCKPCSDYLHYQKKYRRYEKRHKMIKDRHDKVKADYESGAGKMVAKRALLRAQKAAGTKEVTL